MKAVCLWSGLGFFTVFLAGCAATPSPPVNAFQQPQRWEYKVVKMEEGTEKSLGTLLSELGTYGWEYVGQVTGKEEQLIFKRPAAFSPVAGMTGTVTMAVPFRPTTSSTSIGSTTIRRFPILPKKAELLPETRPEVRNRD